MNKKFYERLTARLFVVEDVLTASPATKVYGAGDDNGANDIDWFFV